MLKEKMYLQLFAEDGNGDGEGVNGDGAGNEGGENNNEPISFDDFLKLEGNQAEFDRRLTKAINTAVNNAKAKWQAITDDKLSEAEKLARMDEKERALYENKKLKDKIAEYERLENMAGMTKTARKMLSEENVNIPDELLGNIVFDTAEKTKESVQAFIKMYKDAVQNGVKEALKGKPPKTGSSNPITKEQIMAIKDPVERQKMIADNIELFS